MSYATPEELATALGRPVNPAETESLQACLDAAAEEIDHYVDRTTPLTPAPDADALANRVNIVRGVEWWKSNQAAFGVIGFDQVGSLQAPRDSFLRHQKELIPLKEKFGVA